MIYKSVYKKIADSNRKNGENKLSFAKSKYGAFRYDGSDGYEILNPLNRQLNSDQYRLISRAVISAMRGDCEEALTRFESLSSAIKAVRGSVYVTEHIFRNSARADSNNVFLSAVTILSRTSDPECAKYALALLGTVKYTDEDAKKIAETFASHDEFTYFGILALSNFTDINDMVFELAKKLRGWGRIMAVHELEADDRNKKRWLLENGIDNCVSPLYSALPVWEKAEVGTLLGKDIISPHDFSLISRIVSAVINSEETLDIEVLSRDDTSNYLAHARNMPDLSVEEYDTVLSLMYRSTSYDMCDLASEAMDILSTPDCSFTVKEALKSGKGSAIAAEIGLPYVDEMMSFITENFAEAFTEVSTVFHIRDLHPAIADLFREHIMPEHITDAYSAPAGDPDCLRSFEMIDTVLDNIEDMPGSCPDLVLLALRSFESDLRAAALDVLMEWIRINQQGLPDSYPEFIPLLDDLAHSETDEDNLLTEKVLLSGRFPDEDDYYGDYLCEEMEGI